MRVDLFASESLRLSGRKLTRPFEIHRLSDLESVMGRAKPSIIIGTASELSKLKQNKLDIFNQEYVRVIITNAVPGSPMPRFDKRILHCTLPKLDEREEWRILLAFINNAYDILVLQTQFHDTKRDLEELTKIGVLLSSEKDTDKLLELILTKSREITNCDAGSLYLVQEMDGEKRLLFKMAQNDTIPLNLAEKVLPLNDQSLVGYTVLSGEPLVINDAYNIDPDKPYSHARWVDKAIKYRNISFLIVPLKNLKGEVLGALQLLNRKRNPKVHLLDTLTAMVMVLPFDDHSIELVTSMASLAAVTLEKNMLYESIQNLFEGFVKASVKAIESRDPTTSGHSERVAKLTIKLAKVVDNISSGPLAPCHFSKEDLMELRYAALLHDFGKVGVREQVLVKAKKLYPGEMEVMSMRVKFIKAGICAWNLKRQLDFCKEAGMDEYFKHQKQFENEVEDLLKQHEEDSKLIWEANEPKILAEGNYDKIFSIADKIYTTFDDEPLTLLSQKEAKVLSIPKGTLTEEERLDIESHVSHTFDFLVNIPWTKELRNIPDIASKHHEKLNGKGYPHAVAANDIPMQARMMSICDIFDALTASDRPYKRAVPFEKALFILDMERKSGQLDSRLLDAFVEAKVFDEVKEAKD